MRCFAVLCLACVLPGCRTGIVRHGSAGPGAPSDGVPRALPDAGPAGAPAAPALRQVAAFDHQVTGVAVSPTERIFVCFPRWTEDTPVAVAELRRDGSLRPYPDPQWNAWRNVSKHQMLAADHWVCVQSVFADRRGNLWVLDPAAPALGPVVPQGAKLVRIDLATDEVVQKIPLGPDVAPHGSYLNDVRVTPDGGHAFLTDSGARGALVVVDLAAGRARRVLDGHPSTQPEKDVVVKADGRELRRLDGRGVEVAADGIALAPDGRHLYWQALTGRSLYRILTAALVDADLDAEAVAARVERVGDNGLSDGLWFDAEGRMYISAFDEDAIKVRAGGAVRVLLRDDRLRWPDSFAEGPDGWLYVTASRFHDMAWFRPDGDQRLRTTLFRFPPPGAESSGLPGPR